MADVKQVIYRIDVETSGADQGFASVAKSLNDVEKQSAKTGKAVTDTAKAIGDAFNEQAGVIQKLRSQSQELISKRDASKSRDEIKKLNAEIRKTEKELSKLTNTGATGFRKMLQSAQATFIGMTQFSTISGVIQAGLGALRTGFDTALETEQFETSLAVMLGSVDAAKAKVQELVDFAARTPLQMPDIQSATNTLLAFGIQSDKLIPTLKQLGDVARGNEVVFRSLALIYGQARATNRLYTQDLNQLANRGVPILDILAKQFNTTQEGVRKFAEQGKIDFAAVSKAFETMTGPGGQFNNMMEEMSTKTSGRLSTLSDNFRILMMNFVNLFIPAINSFIEAALWSIQVLTSFGQALGELPKFVSENKVAFGLLVTAIVTLNGNMLVLAASTLYYNAVQKGSIIWTRAATTAMWLWNAAIMANPLVVLTGLILLEAAAIVYLLSRLMPLISAEERRADLIAEITDAIAKEIDANNQLFEVLTDVNSSYDERAEAMAKINEAYGVYLPYLLEEASSLREITELQRQVNEEIFNSALLRAEQANMKALREDEIKQMLDLRQAIKGLNQDEQKRIMDLINDYKDATNQQALFFKNQAQINNLTEEIERNERALTVFRESRNDAGRVAAVNKLLSEQQRSQKRIVDLNKEYAIASGVNNKKEQERIQATIKAEQKRVEDTQRIIGEVNKAYEKGTIDQSIQAQQAAIERRKLQKQELESESANLSALDDAATNTVNRIRQLVADGFLDSLFSFDLDRLKVVKNFGELMDIFDEMASSSVDFKESFIGVRDELENTETATNNAAKATQRYAKLKQFERDILKADTLAIRENTAALREQQLELERVMELRRRPLDPVQGSLEEVRKQTIELQKEASKRTANAKLELDKQLDDARKNLIKQHEVAKEQVKEEQSKEKPNQARIDSLRILADEQKLREQIVALEQNYREELAEIEYRALFQQLQVEQTNYTIRINALDAFIHDQLSLQRQYYNDFRELSLEFDKFYAEEEIGTYEARRLAVLRELELRYTQETEALADIQVKRDEANKNLEESLKKQAELQAKVDSPTGTNEEQRQNVLDLGVLKKQIDAYKEYLDTLDRQEDISLERRRFLNAKYIDAVEKLYIQEAEERTDQNIRFYADSLERERQYGERMFKIFVDIRRDILKYENTQNAKQRAQEIEQKKALLQIYIDAGEEYKKQVEDLQNEIANLEAEDFQAKRDFQRERFLTILTGLKEITDEVLKGLNDTWQQQIEFRDKLIERQTDVVNKAREKANRSKSKGDAEQLQLEEERLEKLNKQKEAFVRKQQALAVVELIVNSTVAIARAVAEGGGIGAAFTVAAVLASLAFGLAAARSQAQEAAASFHTGGYTGDGDHRRRAGQVEYGEFVFNHQQTKKNRDIFEAVHSGKMDLRGELQKARLMDSVSSMGLMRLKPTTAFPALAGGGSYATIDMKVDGLEKRLDALTTAVLNQQRLDVSISEKGLHAIVDGRTQRTNRIRKRSSF